MNKKELNDAIKCIEKLNTPITKQLANYLRANADDIVEAFEDDEPQERPEYIIQDYYKDIDGKTWGINQNGTLAPNPCYRIFFSIEEAKEYITRMYPMMRYKIVEAHQKSK